MTHTPEKTLEQREGVHKSFETYLEKVGLRHTRQRRIILDAVLELGSHVDADTIAVKVRQVDKRIGLATVYRTLNLMTKAHILVQRHFQKDRTHFELREDDETHHDHLICTQCGEIIEFFDQDVENLQEKIANKLGFTLSNHRMELYGVCLTPFHCRLPKQQATNVPLRS